MVENIYIVSGIWKVMCKSIPTKIFKNWMCVMTSDVSITSNIEHQITYLSADVSQW